VIPVPEAPRPVPALQPYLDIRREAKLAWPGRRERGGEGWSGWSGWDGWSGWGEGVWEFWRAVSNEVSEAGRL